MSLSGLRGAFRTIQAAIDFVCGNFEHLYEPNVQVAPGTYNERIIVPNFRVGNTIAFINVLAQDSSNKPIITQPGSVILNHGQNPGNARWYSIVFESTNGGCIVDTSGNGFLQFTNCDFIQSGSQTGNWLVWSGTYTTIDLNQNNSFTINSGYKSAGFLISHGGIIRFNNIGTITFNGVVTDSTVASVYAGAIYNTNNGIAFAGNVTGKRYEVSANSYIFSRGKGVNAFPGTIAGVVDNSDSVYH